MGALLVVAGSYTATLDGAEQCSAFVIFANMPMLAVCVCVCVSVCVCVRACAFACVRYRRGGVAVRQCCFHRSHKKILAKSRLSCA